MNDVFFFFQGKSQASAEPVAPAAVELHGPESSALESTTELEASDIKTPLLKIKVQEPSAGCEGIAQEQGMGNGSAGQAGVGESQSLLE